MIGFLTENYHTEVLDFLFELHDDPSGKYDLVLYNNHDNYLNMELYKKKYEKLEIKTIDTFLPDLNSDYCVKYYIVTYDNLFDIRILQSYKEKILIICHSQKNIKNCIDHGFTYVTLSKMLLSTYYKSNYMWMFPINKNNHNLDDLKKVAINRNKINGNKIKLLSIGTFDNNNKDGDKLNALLSHDNIEFHIFTTKISNLVNELCNKYSDKVKVYDKISTASIINFIKSDNIQYILYTPKEDSEFMNIGKWSGCIAFAYSNNIPLILPKKIANGNNLKGCIEYDDSCDIYNSLLSVHNDDKQLMNIIEESFKFKDFNWKRNLLMKDIILNTKTFEPIYTNHGFICFDKQSTINKLSNVGYISINIIEKLYKDKCNILIINIGSNYGIENYMIKNINKNIPIISIESDLELCMLQKYSNLLNFYTDVKIYNNKIGTSNIEEYITLDNLLINYICNNKSYSDIVIHINDNNNLIFILNSGNDSIKRFEPIFIIDYTIDLQNCKILYDLGYHSNSIDNKVIFSKNNI